MTAPTGRLAELWRRTVAIHATEPKRSDVFGSGYLQGLRDGYANAYAVMTGRSRNAVGVLIRAAVAEKRGRS